MQEILNGATRVHFIVGDPIAQVKSPDGVTRAMRDRGHNAIVVPLHVKPADLREVFEGASRALNVDGIIATVPHKFAAYALCAGATDRGTFLEAVNVMRRDAQGRWYGDMCDGLGHVEAMRARGGEPAGRRVLLVGAGGAGSAIAHAIVMAGAAHLAVHDDDSYRRDTLIERLRELGRTTVEAGSRDPAGFDIVVNATPAGMRPGDPMPVAVEGLRSGMFVSEVITVPAVTPMLEAARRAGCGTMTGIDMFERVRDLMIEFLLASQR